MAPLVIDHLTLRFFGSDPIPFLYSADELIALSIDYLPIVTGQFAPVFLGFADERLHPSTGHYSLLEPSFTSPIVLWATEQTRSKFPLAMSVVASREKCRSQDGSAVTKELHAGLVVSSVASQVGDMGKQSTIAGAICAGLLLATTAFADPLIGAIAGGGHGAGIGAAVGGGVGAIAGAATTPPRPDHRYYRHHVVSRSY